MADSGLDTRAFRDALGVFLTGVTVVTTRDADRRPRGFTANSFTSVSLDPPLILVCIGRSAASHGAFCASGKFAVNVLAETQTDVSRTFASKAADKFASVAWHDSALGNPLIAGAAAWFDCTTQSIIEGGDHSILLGRVHDFGQRPATPLGYCRGGYVVGSLLQSAIDEQPGRVVVGAILERDGELLFLEAADGRLDLPTGASLGPVSDTRSLRAVLARLGLNGRLDFVFSVYEDTARGGGVCVYYRGAAQETPAAGARFIPIPEIPWDRLGDAAVRAMLERYVRERRDDAFGIYVGDARAGEIRGLGPWPAPSVAGANP